MPDTPHKPKQSRTPPLWVFAVIIALLVLIALVVAAANRSSVENEPTLPPSLPAEEPVDEYETVEAALGEPVTAGQYVITVTGGGYEDLEFAEPLPAGSSYYVVTTLFNNNGETVALNGQPWSVDGTDLESDRGPYEGLLQIDPGSPLSQGTIPAGETLELRFIFAVEDGSSDYVFTWTPSTPEYPRIAVPLEE